MINTVYNIKNRSAGRVVYRIPEDGIRREFAPGEVKKIAAAELEKLNYQPGGREIMTQFLQLQSVEAINDLGISVEPEYNMNEQQVVDLIKNGSLEAFLDCLDFAPIGVIDLLKAYAVSVPLSDYQKREALKKKTGFDVDAAIRNAKEDEAEQAKSQEGASTSRITSGRRTTGSNYTIIKPVEEKTTE